MRRIIIVIATLTLLTTLALAGCGQPAPAPSTTPKTTPAPAPEPVKPIELTLNSQFPATSAMNKAYVQWADKIKADSNGRLTVRLYPGATVTTPAEVYPGISKGLSDIGASFKYAYDGPLGTVLPAFLVGVPDASTASKIYMDLYNDFPEFKAEWKEVKVLWLASGGPNFIHTAKKEVKTLADLKGLQMRVAGKLQGQNLSALGGIPVDLSISDYITAIQLGTVAGAVGTGEQLTSHKLADVTQYTTNFAVHCSFANFTAMNLNKFNSLPPDLQKVIDNSMAWGRDALMNAWNGGNQEGIAYAKTKNHTFIDLAPDEFKKWMDVLWAQQEPVAKDLDAKGSAGTKLLKFVQDRIAFYAKK